jgi:hypothetical protein
MGAVAFKIRNARKIPTEFIDKIAPVAPAQNRASWRPHNHHGMANNPKPGTVLPAPAHSEDFHASPGKLAFLSVHALIIADVVPVAPGSNSVIPTNIPVVPICKQEFGKIAIVYAYISAHGEKLLCAV